MDFKGLAGTNSVPRSALFDSRNEQFRPSESASW